MIKTLIPLWSLCLMAGLQGCQSTAFGPDHFPMSVGDTWVYDAAGQEIRFKVTGLKTEGFEIQRTGKKPDVAYVMSVDENGAKILAAFGQPYRPAYTQFAFGTQAGDRWTWQGAIGKKRLKYRCENQGRERVQTPAGTFEAVKIHETLDTPKPSINIMWLAQDVGVVRVLGRQLKSDGKSYDTYDWKLKSYKVKRPKSAKTN